MAFLINRHRPHSDIEVDGAAKFLTGNTMGHVVSASVISAIGLTALFVVDLIDIYFIGLLGEPQLAAAVGFSGSVTFFTMSLGMAGMIAAGAVLSRKVGAGEIAGAKHFFMHTILFSLALSVPIAILLFIFREPTLALFGASGETLNYASSYFSIVVLSFPIMMVGMAASAVLRAHGDFSHATLVTLFAGIVNAVLDPLFIFYFEWGLEGAAIASVCSRIALLTTALYYVIYRYKFWTKYFDGAYIKTDFAEYQKTFVPAALSNLATPIGSGFVISQMAVYGVGVVAGMSVIGRITPVMFSVVLALSGAIGPIIGQNYGAGKYDRVRQTVRDALIFSTAYVAAAAVSLWFIQDRLGELFGLSNEGVNLVSFYANYISLSFIFVAIVFIGNATFNNLGKPVYATYINLLRNIVFSIPFVYVGGLIAGAEGILVGQALGATAVALVTLMVLYWQLSNLKTA